MTTDRTLPWPVGTPVVITTEDGVDRPGFYAGRTGIAGILHKVVAQKKGKAGWCGMLETIRRA